MKERRAQARIPSNQGRRTWLTLAKFLVIGVAVVITYLPVLHAGFVWDDELLVTANPLLRDLSGLREIWAGSRTPDYFPVYSTVFWLEAHLFGQSAAGYHIVNVLLQIANAILVWKALERLQIPGAFLAGLIFGIHPVHAESVAWISELKNLLSMLFYLTSILCFFEAEDRTGFQSSVAYGCSLVSFVLALLSKTQVVFLPIVLLLCVWYRRQRIAASQSKASKRLNKQESAFGKTILRIMPYFLIALALGLTTIWFQNRGIGEEDVVLGTPARRLVNAGMAIWWYAKQVFAPFRLMAIYPPWHFGPPTLIEWLPLVVLIVLVAFLWWWRNRGGIPFFFALSYFIVALLPVVGLMRMAYARSGTLVADHLQYFADISLIALGCAWVSRFLDSPRRGIRILSVTLAFVLVSAMAGYSFARASVYRDEEALWHDNLSKNPNAWQAHNRLGEHYFSQNRFGEAAQHFERAAALKPELAGNHNWLGLAYCRLERFEEGITEYRIALRLTQERPATANTSSTATIRTNLANALTITANNMSERKSDGTNEVDRREAMNRYQEAVSEYEKALEIEPQQPAIHRNLGLLLARLGRTSEAVAHLRKVLQYAPNEPIAREMLESLGARDQ